jgi:flagellar motor protein MotB
MVRFLVVLLCGCAAPPPPPPKKPIPPEIERLDRMEHDAARVQEIAQLDQSNQQKKAAISTLETQLSSLQAKLDDALKGGKSPEADHTVEKAAGGKVRVRLSGELVFAPGSAQLSAEGQKVLNEIAKVLNETAVGRIEIAGHTDSLPTGKRWEDNWQLSAERARHVLAYLHELGVKGKQMIATAWADTDPVDSAANEEAYRKNRRVEIFIEPTDKPAEK